MHLAQRLILEVVWGDATPQPGLTLGLRGPLVVSAHEFKLRCGLISLANPRFTAVRSMRA